MLAASIPSGAPKIRKIRRELKNLIFGPGMFAEWLLHAPLNLPIVSHSLNEDCRDPNAVYVGSGNCMTTLSPWSCPLQPEDFDLMGLRLYIALRADAEVWLLRLTGKVLVCDCKRPADECWAEVLRAEFDTRFNGLLDDDDSRTFKVDDDDFGDDDDDLQMEKYIAGKDEIHGPELNEAGIPHPVPWPDSWVRLVETIRGLKRPSFWEHFAGLERLT